MLSADWSDGVRWGPIGSRWGPIGSDGVLLGPMGSDWVISHTAPEWRTSGMADPNRHFGTTAYLL